MGIRHGLVVTMRGSQVSSPVRVSAGSSQACWPGRFINVRRCGGLSKILYIKNNDAHFSQYVIFLLLEQVKNEKKNLA